ASRMRAAVSVESEVGKGTTFRVSMRRPLAALRRTAPDDKISDVSERQHEPASAEVKQTAGGHAAGRALSGEEKLALQRDMAEIVAQSALFKSLDGAERSALLTRGAVANFAPGQTLIQEGENGDTMYLLLSGNVRVHASADTGHDVSLAELGRAACIGEVSVLTGSARTATVEALTEVDAVVFQRSDVLALAEEHAAVRALLQALVEGRARDTVEKIVDAS
ncbi:MAG: cyclic nucleotide-binding domain-containing protein, partial [Polyangiales bacterium]